MTVPRSATNSAPADPRVERTHQVVRRAVLEQLADVGYGAVTIEAVARRAGVGKATIYRHWPNRLELIADALEHAHHDAVPDLGPGPAHERLARLVRHVAEVAEDPLFSRCIPAIVEGAARDERMRSFLHRYSATRRQELATVIREGITSGQLDQSLDADSAAVTILGIIFYRRFMTPEALEPTEAEAVVRQVVPLSNQPA